MLPGFPGIPEALLEEGQEMNGAQWDRVRYGQLTSWTAFSVLHRRCAHSTSTRETRSWHFWTEGIGKLHCPDSRYKLSCCLGLIIRKLKAVNSNDDKQGLCISHRAPQGGHGGCSVRVLSYFSFQQWLATKINFLSVLNGMFYAWSNQIYFVSFLPFASC